MDFHRTFNLKVGSSSLISGFVWIVWFYVYPSRVARTLKWFMCEYDNIICQKLVKLRIPTTDGSHCWKKTSYNVKGSIQGCHPRRLSKMFCSLRMWWYNEISVISTTFGQFSTINTEF